MLFLFIIFLIVFTLYGVFGSGKQKALHTAYLFLLLVFAPHTPLLLWLSASHSPTGGTLTAALLLCAFALCWTRLHLLPVPRAAAPTKRVRLLAGGRRLTLCGIFICLVQMILYPLLLSDKFFSAPVALLVFDGFWVFAAAGLLMLNGMLRILLTCTRLMVVRRWLVAVLSVIPVFGIIPMLFACHIARTECDHELYKAHLNQIRAENEICKTRYPLVMVHGVGFRDLRYFNYWGRIPGELIRNGATVYYGNQEAWGTIFNNAEDIKKVILQIVEDMGCEKVNIIAHSKGGLDSRYMITKLQMAPYVASLTTISTPHRGCRMVDVAIRMPQPLYRFVSKLVNFFFSALGDKNPDFYTASQQFSTAWSAQFNKDTPDEKGIYYQSYMSVMRSCVSHLLLGVTHLIIRPLEGDNDGLVALESAKWGEFRGVFRNEKGYRGISHGDIIDLTREDYRGFDVLETYVKIVSDLKEKGY